VIHTGDIFFNGFYPFIDVDHGGTVKGMIEAADGILALADGDTLLIAGHGPIGDKAQLQAYRDMLATAYQRLRALRAKGMSAGEAVAQRPLDDLEERWGKGLFPGEKWIGLIYDGLD
jgi:glyoxylase-like metal-dependent hydrolase (beta-lactamase superfamily II)